MTQVPQELLLWSEGRDFQPGAVIFDCTTRQSTPEIGARVRYDDCKQREDSKVHLAVETLGHLLALHVGPANAQDREQVSEMAVAAQDATGQLEQ
jgi:hypothetical protein